MASHKGKRGGGKRPMKSKRGGGVKPRSLGGKVR